MNAVIQRACAKSVAGLLLLGLLAMAPAWSEAPTRSEASELTPRAARNSTEFGWNSRKAILEYLARFDWEAITFQDAVEKVKTENELLLAAQEDINRSDSLRRAARGLYYPKIELEAKRIQLDSPVKVGVNLYDMAEVKLEVQKHDFAESQIQLVAPLYTGGRIKAANRAAQAQQEEARADYRRNEDALISELARRYFGLNLSMRLCAVRQLKVRAMAENAYRAERLVKEGMMAKVEYLNANVALSNAKQELDAAERDTAIVAEGLANIMVEQGRYRAASPLFIIHDIDPIDYFTSKVNEDHPVIRLIDSKNAQARQGVRAEIGTLRPQLYLFAYQELLPEDLTMLDPEGVLGIGMHYTLFDGFQRTHKVGAAKALEKKTEHFQQKYRRDLRSLVIKRYEELQKALEQYLSFKDTIELTRENLRVRQRAFDEGLATSVEIEDATASHARAHLGRLKAAYDFDIALFGLLEASGLTPLWRDYVDRATPIQEYRDDPIEVNVTE